MLVNFASALEETVAGQIADEVYDMRPFRFTGGFDDYGDALTRLELWRVYLDMTARPYNRAAMYRLAHFACPPLES